MSSIDSLLTLLVEELRELYEVERLLSSALAHLVEAASDSSLSDLLTRYVTETETHVMRLDEAFAALEDEADTTTCAGMAALIREASERVGQDYEHPHLRDAALIGAVRRIQHYQIAAYGTASVHAWTLNEDEVAKLLEATLYEEKQANRTLLAIGKHVVRRKPRRKRPLSAV